MTSGLLLMLFGWRPLGNLCSRLVPKSIQGEAIGASEISLDIFRCTIAFTFIPFVALELALLLVLVRIVSPSYTTTELKKSFFMTGILTALAGAVEINYVQVFQLDLLKTNAMRMWDNKLDLSRQGIMAHSWHPVL